MMGVCVCCLWMLTYSSRTDPPCCTEFGMLNRRSLEQILGKLKLLKHYPELESTWGDFCSSEAKHDRKTASKPMFVSARTLRRQGPHPRETAPVWSPGKNVVVACKLSTIEKWRLEENWFFWRRYYRNSRHKPGICHAFVSPGEMLGLGIIFSGCQTMRPVESFRAVKVGKKFDLVCIYRVSP